MLQNLVIAQIFGAGVNIFVTFVLKTPGEPFIHGRLPDKHKSIGRQ